MLSEFLDGELGDAERSDVTFHLEACADCARFAAELAATVDALRRLLRGTAGLLLREHLHRDLYALACFSSLAFTARAVSQSGNFADGFAARRLESWPPPAPAPLPLPALLLVARLRSRD
jgi:hypothetical protein